MKLLYKLISAVALTLLFNTSVSARSNELKAETGFQMNMGQVRDQNGHPRPDVLSYGTTQGLNYYLRKNGVSFQQSKTYYSKPSKTGEEIPGEEVNTAVDSVVIYRIDESWIGSNPDPVIVTDEELKNTNNYYLGNGKNILGVKTYGQVIYKDIYPGIDLKYHQKQGNFEYDYMVKPGADYRSIRIKLEGALSVKLNKDGTVTVKTPLGHITEGKPEVFQDGQQIAANWVIRDNILSYNIPRYDKEKELVIDPLVREWGTYYGEFVNDLGKDIRTDNSGNVYFCGSTRSQTGIATIGAYQTTLLGLNANSDNAFLVKFDSTGARLWGTYMGSAVGDKTEATKCLTGSNNDVYLIGNTNSSSGITTIGAYQDVYGGSIDGFLAKFDANGSRIWCTYIGGSDTDQCNGGSIDNAGNIYLAGVTESTNNISTTGAHQTVLGGGGDGFLMKFDAAGQKTWGTYYGGSLLDVSKGCTADQFGNIYLFGYTTSSADITTAGCHKPTLSTLLPGSGQALDGFLVKFDTAGVRSWGTYLGGHYKDYILDCAADTYGTLYIVGQTGSGSGIATPGAFKPSFLTQSQGAPNAKDGFLVKFDSTGVREWGTYYGGRRVDQFSSCAVLPNGKVYAAGRTFSPTGVASSGAHQVIKYHPLNYVNDELEVGMLVKFGTNGQRLWASYYGGGVTHINACCIDNSENVYIVGETNDSVHIATPGAYEPIFPGLGMPVESEAHIFTIFLAKFAPCNKGAAPVVTPAGVTTVYGNDSVQFSTPLVPGMEYQWEHNGVGISGATNHTYTATEPGEYVVGISNGCAEVSEPATMVISPFPLSVGVVSGNAGVQIIPNPTTGIINITGNLPEGIMITDITGRKVLEATRKQSLNMGSLASGTYLIKLYDSNGRLYHQEKIIKQ